MEIEKRRSVEGIMELPVFARTSEVEYHAQLAYQRALSAAKWDPEADPKKAYQDVLDSPTIPLEPEVRKWVKANLYEVAEIDEGTISSVLVRDRLIVDGKNCWVHAVAVTNVGIADRHQLIKVMFMLEHPSEMYKWVFGPVIVDGLKAEQIARMLCEVRVEDAPEVMEERGEALIQKVLECLSRCGRWDGRGDKVPGDKVFRWVPVCVDCGASDLCRRLRRAVGICEIAV